MWSAELRERTIQRLLDPNCPLLVDLAVSTGIPRGTLARWRHEARNEPSLQGMFMGNDDDQSRRPSDWSATQRMRVLMDSSALSEAALGEFLRREGLHQDTLIQWKSDALAGLEKPKSRRTTSRRERALEREIRRKDKALAEVAALLVLQKKAHLLLGGNEDDGSGPK